VRPCTAHTRLFRLFNTQIGALRDTFPAYRSFANHSGEINDLWRKPREKFQFGKKIHECIPLLINGSSIMQKQEAL
jgi:hypothetical protein